MEFAHLESRLNFLDEEYRQEKRDLAQLRQRVDSQQAEIAEYQQRIQELEATINRLQTQINRHERFEDMIQRFKNEMTAMLEDQEARRRQSFKDAERARQMELDAQGKALHEVRREIERGRGLDEDLVLARTELERMGGLIVAIQQRVDNLAKQGDEQVRNLSYLENQRRNDAKKVAELQVESSDVLKKTDLNLSKIQMVEQQLLGYAKFQTAVDEIRESTKQSLEAFQFQEAHFQRQMTGWLEQAEVNQRRLDEYETRMTRYAELHQLNRKTLEALQEFQERLQREQHESMELQRLAEERAKHQSEDWQSDIEQKWKQHSLDWEHQFQRMTQNVEKLTKRLEAAETTGARLQPQINLLVQAAEEYAHTQAVAAHDWQRRFEELMTQETG
jgi:chromosome segregation ATPase